MTRTATVSEVRTYARLRPRTTERIGCRNTVYRQETDDWSLETGA